MKNCIAFFALIVPNLRSFGINMPLAVHWNHFEVRKKNWKFWQKMKFYQFLN